MITLLTLLACADKDTGDTAQVTPEPELQHIFSFAVLADPHISSNLEHDQRLAAAVSWINEQADEQLVELVMVVGDIGWGEGLVRSRDLLEVLDMPYVPVLGDNEVHFGDEQAFEDTFNAQYTLLSQQLDDWQKSPVGTFNPQWERDSWFQNFSFTHRGVHFVALDWVSRDNHDLLSELAELHDFEGGTYPWFDAQLEALPEGPMEDTLLFSHHAMHMPSFNVAQMDQLMATTTPQGHRVAASFAGHYHLNIEETLWDAGYDVFVTDATWDDEDTVRMVQVWGNGERFELRQELVLVDWEATN